MPRTYAWRYSLIALIVGSVFACSTLTLEVFETALPLTLDSVQKTIGWGDVLVITSPFALGFFAYLAGRQRDRGEAQARYLDSINQVNRTLTRALDLDQTLPEALQQVTRALRLDHAALYLFDRAQLALRATTPQLPDSLLMLAQQMQQLEHWLPVLLPRTADQTLVTIDLADDAAVPGELRQGEYRGLVSVLIQSGGENTGLLLIAAHRPVQLSSAQRNFLIAAASQIGAAVARARPYAELKRRARDLDAIAQVNRTLLAGMGLDDLLDTVVNAAQVRFGLPYVAVLWVDEAAGEFVVRAQAGPLAAAARIGRRLQLTQGLSARVYRTGQLYLARDVRSEPDYIRASDAPVLSSLLIPMKASGQVTGIMAFDSLGLDAFSEADIAALTTLTGQMTIAAENARLYAEAQRERRRIAAILRSTRDVVLLIDPASLVQLLNPAAERVLGVSAAAGAGQPIEQVLAELPVREAYHWLSNSSPDDDRPPREALLGSAVYLMTLTTARDEAGQFFGRVLVMHDITYLKQLDQFRTQVIQMTSHDLRNPLGVAVGYLELLVEDLTPLTPLRSQMLNGLGHALTRMQNLVTDLLDMERIEAGADRRREAVSLERLTTDVIDELRRQVEAKHQNLDVSIAPALPAITGDPVHLKQALINLIGNAIKYTPDRGQIWVRLQPGDHQLIFEVQDTGYGIPAAAQANLFQRFFRAKTPGTEHIDGTGLGLSLVKAVIEQHGGRISAESEEGKGSTFRVELPVTGDQ